MMGDVNCLRCRFRHEDNGNCTAVGGFCTAVPAAHCPLLREYLDTGLTPEEIKTPSEDTMINLAAQALCVEPSRLRELAKADKDGRLEVLPCRGDADIVLMRNGIAFKPDHWNIHLTAFAENQPTPSGKKVALFDLSEVQESMEGKG